MAVEVERKQNRIMTISEIVQLDGPHLTNEPVFIAPPEILQTAFDLQADVKKTAHYLESLFLVYQDCTLNHVQKGIPLQGIDGVYQWLTPAEFSWIDIERVIEIGDRVRKREQEKFDYPVANSFEVHDLSSGKVYYEKIPNLDKEIKFIVPYELGFVHPYDWTSDAARLKKIKAEVENYLHRDELLEYQGRRILLEFLETLSQPVH